MEQPEEDTQYADEDDTRARVVAALQSCGYHLDTYTISDKNGDSGRVRTLTIKAARDLDYHQLTLDNAG